MSAQIAQDIANNKIVPNFIDPPTRAPMVIGTNIAFCVFSLIFVVARCISRATILGKFTYEDHLVIIAWFLSVFTSFCMAYSTKQGTGRHIWDVPMEWLQDQAFPSTWIMTWTYCLALTVIKLSILIFYLRLTPQRIYKYINYGIMFYVGVGGLIEVFLMIFACNPIQASWDFALQPTATCINTMLLYRVVAFLNFFGDLAILLLPLPMVWQLQLPTRQKLSVAVIFLLGGLVTVVSLVRIVLVIQAENSGDYTWVGAMSAVWSAVEVNVAIICACLPAVKPLISKYFPRFLSTTGLGRSQPKPSYAAGYAPYQLSNMKSGNHTNRQSGVYHGKDDGILTSVLGRKGNNPNESEEYIVKTNGDAGGIGITKTVEFNVKVDASSEFGTTTQHSDRSQHFNEKQV